MKTGNMPSLMIAAPLLAAPPDWIPTGNLYVSLPHLCRLDAGIYSAGVTSSRLTWSGTVRAPGPCVSGDFLGRLIVNDGDNHRVLMYGTPVLRLYMPLVLR